MEVHQGHSEKEEGLVPRRSVVVRDRMATSAQLSCSSSRDGGGTSPTS